MSAMSPEQRAKLSLQVQKVMRHYLQLESWTPVMGAMLLAGLTPKAGCTTLPTDGAVSLDGSVIKGAGNKPFSEARWILQEWNDRCEEDGTHPTQIRPTSFLAWCVEDQVQERLSVLSPFRWITAFKSLAGYGPRHEVMDFDLAAHIANSAEPLQTILDKIEALERVARQDQGLMLPAESPSAQSAERLGKASTGRAYLTTEELALALHVEPESIHKARSKNGHYCGVQPTKLPNRRLAWPLDSVERITNAS